MAPHGTDTRQRIRESSVQSEPSPASDRQLNGERNCPLDTRTHSLDSRTAASGRPTIVCEGSPRLMSISTWTGVLSRPIRAKLVTLASIVVLSPPTEDRLQQPVYQQIAVPSSNPLTTHRPHRPCLIGIQTVLICSLDRTTQKAYNALAFRISSPNQLRITDDRR